MATLHAVSSTLHHLQGSDGEPRFTPRISTGFRAGPQRLRKHAERLLGERPSSRDVRIMVTMPSAAATDPSIIAGFVAAGMNVMRINCAHDDPEVWHAMLDQLDDARRTLGRPCRVLADLSGPKLRRLRWANLPHENAPPHGPRPVVDVERYARI